VFILVPKLRLGTLSCETPFRGRLANAGNRVSRTRVPKRSLGTRFSTEQRGAFFTFRMSEIPERNAPRVGIL